MAIKAGLLVSNDSTRIRWDWEGGVDFSLPTPTETLYSSLKPRSRMRVELWGVYSTRISSERGLLYPLIGVSAYAGMRVES